MYPLCSCFYQVLNDGFVRQIFRGTCSCFRLMRCTLEEKCQLCILFSCKYLCLVGCLQLNPTWHYASRYFKKISRDHEVWRYILCFVWVLIHFLFTIIE
uniref:Uncharacterized protein n=1 Tax=Arundo donax TaxID=35708 RepID=A0A0A9D2E4_ARUDO